MKPNSRILLPGLLTLLLTFAGAVSASLGDLYAAEVPVASDSPEERNTALGQAMQEVLVRLSGRADVAGRRAAASVIERAPSLVQQFRYRVDEGLLGTAGSEPAPPQRYLWAKFDKLAVDRLLRDSDIPVWGARRPRVLLWLAVEQGSGRSLLNAENDLGTRRILLNSAYQRGMPLQLPLMDLQDQAALSAADLWAGYEAALRQASARYPHDVILSGRLRAAGKDRWSAEWTLWGRDDQDSFATSGLSWAASLAAGIGGAQDRLATRYAPAAGGDGPDRVRVLFTGVDSLPAYGRLLEILKGREAITRINLRETQGDTLRMDIWVRGGRNALARMLSLGGEFFLQPDSVPGVTPPDAAETQGGVEPPPAEPVDMTFSFLPSLAGVDEAR